MLPNTNNQKGMIPIIFLLLILILIAGVGVGIVELAANDSEKGFGNRVKQFFNARFKKDIDYVNSPEKQNETVTSEEADSTQGNLLKKRSGELILKFNLTNFPDTSEKKLSISYDKSTVTGTFPLTNQGNNISFNVLGTIDSFVGRFTIPLSTTSTQKVNAGKISGYVTAQYSGAISGKIDITGKTTGSLELNQKITSIEGNIPQLKVGDTQQIKANLTGLTTPK